MTDYPLISVIMCTYNESAAHITESVNSILDQSYNNFELIIILDDPNNILIKNIIQHFANIDSRLIFKENTTNLGLACSLNEALKLSRGKYIARMDSDDISLSHRLSNQIRYLEDNADVDLVGSSVELINNYSEKIGLMLAPNTEIIPADQLILYQTVAYHPTWMFRRRLIDKIGGYNNLKAAQDFDFLARALRNGAEIRNLSDVLLRYRIRDNSIGNSNNLIQLKSKFFTLNNYKHKKLFSYSEYEKYIKTATLFIWLHRKSSSQYLKYTKTSNKILRIYHLLMSALLSPYASKNYFIIALLKIKIMCRLISTNKI